MFVIPILGSFWIMCSLSGKRQAKLLASFIVISLLFV